MCFEVCSWLLGGFVRMMVRGGWRWSFLCCIMVELGVGFDNAGTGHCHCHGLWSLRFLTFFNLSLSIGLIHRGIEGHNNTIYNHISLSGS